MRKTTILILGATVLALPVAGFADCRLEAEYSVDVDDLALDSSMPKTVEFQYEFIGYPASPGIPGSCRTTGNFEILADFGDGSTDTIPVGDLAQSRVISHEYTEPGLYEATFSIVLPGSDHTATVSQIPIGTKTPWDPGLTLSVSEAAPPINVTATVSNYPVGVESLLGRIASDLYFQFTESSPTSTLKVINEGVYNFSWNQAYFQRPGDDAVYELVGNLPTAVLDGAVVRPEIESVVHLNQPSSSSHDFNIRANPSFSRIYYLSDRLGQNNLFVADRISPDSYGTGREVQLNSNIDYVSFDMNQDETIFVFSTRNPGKPLQFWKATRPNPTAMLEVEQLEFRGLEAWRDLNLVGNPGFSWISPDASEIWSQAGGFGGSSTDDVDVYSRQGTSLLYLTTTPKKSDLNPNLNSGDGSTRFWKSPTHINSFSPIYAANDGIPTASLLSRYTWSEWVTRYRWVEIEQVENFRAFPTSPYYSFELGTLSADASRLLISAAAKDSLGHHDLYLVKLVSDAVEGTPTPVPTTVPETTPTVSPSVESPTATISPTPTATPEVTVEPQREAAAIEHLLNSSTAENPEELNVNGDEVVDAADVQTFQQM